MLTWKYNFIFIKHLGKQQTEQKAWEGKLEDKIEPCCSRRLFSEDSEDSAYTSDWSSGSVEVSVARAGVEGLGLRA